MNDANSASRMNVKQLRQELTKHGLPADGLKPALIERLEQAMQPPKKKSSTTSNEDYHTLTARAASDKLLIAERGGRSPSARQVIMNMAA